MTNKSKTTVAPDVELPKSDIDDAREEGALEAFARADERLSWPIPERPAMPRPLPKSSGCGSRPTC
jgi:hypothetical protein